MAVELTDEEKAKLDAVLKDMGYDDHAKDVIAKRNLEAKTQREQREAAEAKLKKYEDEEAARKSEAEKRKAEEDAAKKKADDEKKSVEERLSAIEKSFVEKLTASEQAASKKQAEFLDELKARDAQILMQAVRVAATKRGIIDEDLVAMLDVSKVPIERGIPAAESIDELIDSHVESKPHLYRKPDERVTRDDGGRFVRPSASDKTKSVDAAKIPDDEFAALEARLRSGKA